jgi:hypothetical protein
MSKILEQSYGRTKVLWLLETYIQNRVNTDPFRNLSHSTGDSKWRLNMQSAVDWAMCVVRMALQRRKQSMACKDRNLSIFEPQGHSPFASRIQRGSRVCFLGSVSPPQKGLHLCWPQPKKSGIMCAGECTTLGQHQTPAVLAGDLLRVSFPTTQTARKGFVLLRGAGKVMLGFISLPSWSTWYVQWEDGTLKVEH